MATANGKQSSVENRICTSKAGCGDSHIIWRRHRPPPQHYQHPNNQILILVLAASLRSDCYLSCEGMPSVMFETSNRHVSSPTEPEKIQNPESEMELAKCSNQSPPITSQVFSCFFNPFCKACTVYRIPHERLQPPRFFGRV